MKKVLWTVMTYTCLVVNFLVLWVLLNVTLKYDFRTILALLLVLIAVITNVMNAVLVVVFYEKAQYNQEFVDIVQEGLKDMKDE